MRGGADGEGIYCEKIESGKKYTGHGELSVSGVFFTNALKNLIDKFLFIVYYQLTRLRTFLFFMGNIIP